jgi:hypothetical protein
MVQEKDKQNREIRRKIEDVKSVNGVEALKWKDLENEEKRKGVENGL